VPGAIVKDEEERIDRNKCSKCMVCVDACLGKALQKVGERIAVEEVLKRIVAYKPFFDRSDDGGITLSGGDPAFQPEFTLRLLKSCRELGIHSVVETCGYTNYEILKQITEASDLIIYDLKHMDDASHIKGTGVSNRVILENLRRLCKEVDTEIVVHLPLICGFNDDEENIMRTAEFVSSLRKIKHVDLLPFNELASGKYRAMGIDWEYAEVRRQSPEHLARLQEIVETYGLEVTIGGLW
jgi:pyruvate formate lyase activating enzyme